MPERLHLRRLANVWIKNPVFFVTVCTGRRRRFLDRPQAAAIIVSAFQDAPRIHGWVIGRYVVMPDHVHFFALPRPDGKSLSDFVRDWKKWTAHRLIGEELASPPVWQPEFFDHLLRSAKSYSEKWEYVRANPVRAGLVARAEDWPHQGEGERLRIR